MARSTRRRPAPRRPRPARRNPSKTVARTKKVYAGYKRYREWGGLSNFLFGEHSCPVCRRPVPNWNASWHAKDHAARMETATLLPNVVAQGLGEPQPVRSPSGRPQRPQRPLGPSAEKTAERNRRGSGIKPAPKPKPDHLVQKAIRMANRLTDSLRRAWVAWGEFVPETADDAQADFEGLTQATLVASRVVEHKIAELAKVGIDPRVLAKLSAYQEGLAEIAMLPAEAYALMYRIYQPAMNGTDQSIPAPSTISKGA